MDSTIYLVINILIVLLLLIGFVLGWKKGLLYEICSFLLNFVALFCAYKFCGDLANKISIVNLDNINIGFEGFSLININLTLLANQVIWFLIIFLGAKLIFFIISPLIKAFSDVPLLGKLNKLVGGLVGSINVLIILIIVSAILKITPIDSQYKITDNTFLQYTDTVTDWVTNFVSQQFTNSNTSTSDSSVTSGVTSYLNSLDDEGYKNLTNYLNSLDEDDYNVFVTYVNSLSGVLGKDVVNYVNNLDEAGYKALLAVFKVMKNMNLNSFINYVKTLNI